jgi:lipopolysaccharide export system permease protein
LIIRWYLIKELIKTFFAVFLVIFLILLSTQVLRVLSAVSSGAVTMDVVFILLGLTNLQSIATLFPISLFLSIIIALSRFYKDSEIIAMWACGISPKIILTSLFPVIIAFVVIEFIFALHVSPWAHAQINHVKNHVASNADVDLLESGRFNIFANGERVLYVEEIDKEGVLNHVFLRITNGVENSSVIFADKARIKTDDKSDARYIVFTNGYRYDGMAGDDDYRVVTFDEYGVLIVKPKVSDVKYDNDEKSFKTLINESDNKKVMAEIQWRISLVLSLLILSLLAIPLSNSSPRKGRFSKIFPAIIVYFVYSNLLNVAQSLVKKGDLSPIIGMWWVHIIFLALFVYLFSHQMGWFHSHKIKKRSNYA